MWAVRCRSGSHVDGPPPAHLNLFSSNGRLFSPLGHRSPCLRKSRGLGQSPRNCPFTHRFCRRTEKNGYVIGIFVCQHQIQVAVAVKVRRVDVARGLAGCGDNARSVKGLASGATVSCLKPLTTAPHRRKTEGRNEPREDEHLVTPV